MREQYLHFDFCVIGGGLAGLGAAVAAARHGVKTVLIQDRPVLGGNCSGEVRVHVCGAHGSNNRETGIIEELKLENRYRNPLGNYSTWDSIMYAKAQYQDNLHLFLNCAINEVESDNGRITAVRGYQSTNETRISVSAALFADCSGDGLIGYLAGADFRIGREPRGLHDEPIEPFEGDKKTMGMSCVAHVRETSAPQPFIAPEWAIRVTEEDLCGKPHKPRQINHFWWVELGGEYDSIRDTEELKHRLLQIVYGVWDHVKNGGDHDAENWVLEWVGFVPGKRESRRLLGDHILSQKEIEAGGKFDDTVAYGGWTMDDHYPDGWFHYGCSTIFHPAPSPYGIPYRSLYSRNIDNLFMAGRNISVTHAALSSTRVMATCATLGQAVGVAASLALHYHTTPRGVYQKHLALLQRLLLEDDCYLPGFERSLAPLTAAATLTTEEGDDADVLRNGLDRPVEENANYYRAQVGKSISYRFAHHSNPVRLRRIRLVFDSDLNDERAGRQPDYYSLDEEKSRTVVAPLPPQLVKSYRLELFNGDRLIDSVEIDRNYRRLLNHTVDCAATAVRFTPTDVWGGGDTANIFAFDIFD